MLDLRPSCEHCDTDLPADSSQARVCSFECTFCATCVDSVLSNVCPNCGGGFEKRPIRPANDYVGPHLGNRPASTERKHKPVDTTTHADLVKKIAGIAPENR